MKPWKGYNYDMDTNSPEFWALKIGGIIITILFIWSARKYYAKAVKSGAPAKNLLYGQPLIFGGILLVLVLIFAGVLFYMMNSAS